MSVAPAPNSITIKDEENFNPNATATNMEAQSTILSPEPLFPPIRGAEPLQEKTNESINQSREQEMVGMENRTADADISMKDPLRGGVENRYSSQHTLEGEKCEGGDSSTNKI